MSHFLSHRSRRALVTLSLFLFAVVLSKPSQAADNWKVYTLQGYPYQALFPAPPKKAHQNVPSEKGGDVKFVSYESQSTSGHYMAIVWTMGDKEAVVAKAQPDVILKAFVSGVVEELGTGKYEAPTKIKGLPGLKFSATGANGVLWGSSILDGKNIALVMSMFKPGKGNPAIAKKVADSLMKK